MSDAECNRGNPCGDIAKSKSHALRYDAERRVRHTDSIMARMTADLLVCHLLAGGFVVIKKGGALPRLHRWRRKDHDFRQSPRPLVPRTVTRFSEVLQCRNCPPVHHLTR
jgi:hypothetical protein